MLLLKCFTKRGPPSDARLKHISNYVKHCRVEFRAPNLEYRFSILQEYQMVKYYFYIQTVTHFFILATFLLWKPCYYFSHSFDQGALNLSKIFKNRMWFHTYVEVF